MASNPHQHNQLLTLFAAYAKRLDKLYDDFVTRLIASLPLSEDEVWQKLADNPLFLFDNFPELKARLQRIFDDFVNKQVLCYKAGITDGVALAFSQDKINLGKYTILQDEAIKAARNAAVASFIANRMSRKEGLSLSDKVWNYSQLGKSEVEMGISNVIKDGLKAGTSAEELGRKVRQYLNNPTMMYRRYWVNVATAGGGKKKVARWYRRHIDEKTGKVTFKDEPLERVGTGVYRSARMNGYRLMRTEINMSYHKANASRWANEPFVYGIRVWKSPEHPKEDICDELEGYYPKAFQFCGWHPSCYKSGTYVLTNNGWKLFQDVDFNDKILSLNPEDRSLEYVDIVAKQAYHYNGEMEHFFNRSLDCEVTADHRMVYLNKNDGKIKYTFAKSYRKGNGAFYRGCEYKNADKSFMTVGSKQIPFDLFCEFMGYWLSDGCLVKNTTVVLCQMEGQPAYEGMIDCLTKMGYTIRKDNFTLYFHDKDLCTYLTRFGKCYTKYIPNEILSASKRQIKIFLDAFIKCDGHEKQPHPFIGNHGNIFIPKDKERTYYTTSPKMCGNLCELLLKIGHRPSISIQPASITQKKDGSFIKGNYDCYIIRECHAQTATVFDKESYRYDGMVYDLTLAKNHIMYVQYNGTCFWGSNCMCASAPLTLYGDEKRDFYRRLMKGEDMNNFHSVHEITEKNMNPNWKHYIETQHDAILKAGERGKLAYHLRDNQQYWINQFSKEEQKKMGLQKDDKARIKVIADARHAARTPEQAKDIADRWHEHKRVDALVRQANSLIPELKEYPLVANWKVLQEAANERNARTLEKLLGDKMILKKLAYEKIITPPELKWSEYVKNIISEGTATWAQNTMSHIVRDARKLSSSKEAVKFLQEQAAKRVESNLMDKELNGYRLMLDRETRRMKDWFDYQRYSRNIDMIKSLVDKNADVIGGAFKRLTVSASDFYLQDLEAMRKLVNETYFQPYFNLRGWSDSAAFVAKSKSPIVHQLYDGILNAYRTQGFTADVEDMVDKLQANIDRLKKEAEKAAERKAAKEVSPLMNEKLAKHGEYLGKKDEFTFDRSFFDMLEKKFDVAIPHTNKGSYEHLNGAEIVLDNDKRGLLSLWEKHSVVYHEGGHAIADQRGLLYMQELADLRNKIIAKWKKQVPYSYIEKKFDWDKGEYVTRKITRRRAYWKDLDARAEEICQRLRKVDRSFFTKRGITYDDFVEQMCAFRDTISSLFKRNDYGHSVEYFSTKYHRRHEFLAHCFENTFIGNRVFEHFAPEEYKEMIALIRKWQSEIKAGTFVKPPTDITIFRHD